MNKSAGGYMNIQTLNNITFVVLFLFAIGWAMYQLRKADRKSRQSTEQNKKPVQSKTNVVAQRYTTIDEALNSWNLSSDERLLLQRRNTLHSAKNEQGNQAGNSQGNRANEQDNRAGNQQHKQHKIALYARVLAYKANEQKEQSNNGNSIICSICRKEFLSIKARSGHMRIHK
jgi:hypothetical protein